MLKAEMLAAMPAMNAASRPAIATPSMPLGSRSRISSSSASLYFTSPPPPPDFRSTISGTMIAAMMPGTITMNGTNILGKAPMIGVRRAADTELEAIARCTSTKFVVQ